MRWCVRGLPGEVEPKNGVELIGARLCNVAYGG